MERIQQKTKGARYTEEDRIMYIFGLTSWAWEELLWERGSYQPEQLTELDRIGRLYLRNKITLESYLRRLRMLKSQRQAQCDSVAAELLTDVEI